MNVLLLGSGGREHALAWNIAKSPLLEKLYIAPGNAGTASVGINLPIAVTAFPQIKEAVKKHAISMVIVGPEDPLVNGIHDFFLADDELKNIPVIGPQKHAATLEGSKEFAKSFMMRHNIPTANYFTVTTENIAGGFAFLDKQTAPFVLKADGLAGGKGVLILNDLNEAKSELQNMLNGKFGTASKTVVIEECLKGIEMSVFVLTDGENYLLLPEAKDYKRIGEHDTGLNTGGMGAVSPVPFADKALMARVEEEIIKPTIQGLKNDGIPYCGFIFFGLMNDNGVPKVIEYNVRMGDPETEVVVPRIKSDLLQLFVAAGNKTLGQEKIEINPFTATTVMAVSGGYPEAYEKGKTITFDETITDSIVFHAGTTLVDGEVKTSGGRVLAVTSLGVDKSSALQLSYKNIAKIHYDKMYYRRDIGLDLQ